MKKSIIDMPAENTNDANVIEPTPKKRSMFDIAAFCLVGAGAALIFVDTLSRADEATLLATAAKSPCHNELILKEAATGSIWLKDINEINQTCTK